MKRYGMDGKELDDTEAAKLWMTPGARVVEQTKLASGRWVSTVLLVYDHNHAGKGPPIIFETMVFESENNLRDLACERYSTVEEARLGHLRLVAEWGGRLSDDEDPES
jgi:hypothetical protein